ncbi:MAG: dienelactone hydrolase family protein [Caulobacter sp.]|nr:dienelactone hydrolase family protein [Caulobacter sp.]
MTDILTLESALDGFDFTALHAAPAGPRKGGVVVLQEIFGLDHHVRADVARWAALGFEVLAPSLFDREERGFTAEHTSDGLAKGVATAAANGFDNPIGDVQACIDHLKARGPVFVVGYCYGGSIAWMAASRCTDLAAAASYYGSMVQRFAALPLAAPVVVHLGRNDAHIPADAVEGAVLAAHPDVAVHIYENSGHGFNNAGRADAHPADAQLARERTLALFEGHGAI